MPVGQLKKSWSEADQSTEITDCGVCVCGACKNRHYNLVHRCVAFTAWNSHGLRKRASVAPKLRSAHCPPLSLVHATIGTIANEPQGAEIVHAAQRTHRKFLLQVLRILFARVGVLAVVPGQLRRGPPCTQRVPKRKGGMFKFLTIRLVLSPRNDQGSLDVKILWRREKDRVPTCTSRILEGRSGTPRGTGVGRHRDTEGESSTFGLQNSFPRPPL